MNVNHEGVGPLGSLCDVDWGLRHGAIPIPDEEIANNELMVQSLSQMNDIIANMEGESLNLIGSSGGSAPAAQTALYLLNHREEYGLGENQQITLTLSSKMLDEDSSLVQELVSHQAAGNFTILMQDYEDDNIDGVSGTDGDITAARRDTIEAFFLPENGNRGMVPWPVNVADPLAVFRGRHTHNSMADSSAKANSLVRELLINRQFGTPEQRERAETVLAEMEASGRMDPISELEEVEDFHTLPLTVPYGLLT